MGGPRLRAGVRALIVDDDDRVLLCRWDFPDVSVWGTPGGGIETGETHVPYDGTDLFAPRDMAGLLATLLQHGAPTEPLVVGL